MLGMDIENKEKEKGYYKGFRIVKKWSEKKGESHFLHYKISSI